MISQQARSRKKKKEDRQAQLAYWEQHRYCEVCKAHGVGMIDAIQVHEILYKSQGGKCVPDNMIALCQHHHDCAHFKQNKWLYRSDLLKIKNRG